MFAFCWFAYIYTYICVYAYEFYLTGEKTHGIIINNLLLYDCYWIFPSLHCLLRSEKIVLNVLYYQITSACRKHWKGRIEQKSTRTAIHVCAIACALSVVDMFLFFIRIGNVWVYGFDEERVEWKCLKLSWPNLKTSFPIIFFACLYALHTFRFRLFAATQSLIILFFISLQYNILLSFNWYKFACRQSSWSSSSSSSS